MDKSKNVNFEIDTSKRNQKIIDIFKLSFNHKSSNITMYNNTLIIKWKCYEFGNLNSGSIYFCVIDFSNGSIKILINGNLIFEETFEETIVDLNNSGLSEDDELNIHDFGNEIFELWEKIIS
jgi:hypothetical protein